MTETYNIDPDGDVMLLLSDNEGIDLEVLSSQLNTVRPSTSESTSQHDENTEEPSIDVPKSEPKQLRVRVSSKHLSLASDHFKALFQPTFQTGRALQANGFVEIKLPDYPPALIVLLHILHLKTRKVPLNLDLEMLAQVAKLVDLYFLHEAVEPYSRLWIDAILSDGNIPCSLTDDLLSWISICWVFGQGDHLRSAVTVLPMESTHKLDFHDLPLPLDIAETIENSRRYIVGKGIDSLREIHQSYESPDIICPNRGLECDSMVLGMMIKSLKSKNLFPLPEAPYDGISLDMLREVVGNMRTTSLCYELSKLRFKGKRYVTWDDGNPTCGIEAGVNRIEVEMKQAIDQEAIELLSSIDDVTERLSIHLR